MHGLLRTCIALSLAALATGMWSSQAQEPQQRRGPTTQLPARVSRGPLVAPDGRSGSFSALTYNVAGLPGLISKSRPRRNTPSIATRLNGYDLVLAQEDFWYHGALSEGARHRYQSVPGRATHGFFGDGLNRFSALPFDPLTRQEWNVCSGVLSQRSDCLAGKGFSMAETSLAPGAVVHVYNHHADAGDSQHDQRARHAQFAQLARFVHEHSAGEAVIVAGDTNLHPSSTSDANTLARFLSHTGLRDACEILDCGVAGVDRFFYRGSPTLELRPTNWEQAPEFTDSAGQPLSDHGAVHVRFDWRRNDALSVLR